jgi:hypothetical protein
LRDAVRRKPIAGVFLSSEAQLGDGPKPPKMWTHFAVPNPRVFRATALRNASQAAAEKQRDGLAVLDRHDGAVPLQEVPAAVAVVDLPHRSVGERAEEHVEQRLGRYRQKQWRGRGHACGVPSDRIGPAVEVVGRALRAGVGTVRFGSRRRSDHCDSPLLQSLSFR